MKEKFRGKSERIVSKRSTSTEARRGGAEFRRKTSETKKDVAESRRNTSEIKKDAAVKEIRKTDVVREDIIEGRNAVIEALKSDRTIEQIFVAKGDTKGSINVVFGLAKEKGIVVKQVERAKLDAMSELGNHQGVIAMVTPYKYYQVSDIFEYAQSKNEEPFILILDEIEDPHNLGSIIRTAEVCGVHGIIIPKRKNVGITPTVYKTSVGATEYIKIAKVTNINATIEELKEQGVWVYGADMVGEKYCYEANLKGAIALVVGSEGKGISKLTKEKCDVLIKIPMVGKVNSLNASVACGIVTYEIMKQRIL